MPWVAGALGGTSLVTQGLGGGFVYIVIDTFWVPPIELALSLDEAFTLKQIALKRKRRNRLRSRAGQLGG